MSFPLIPVTFQPFFEQNTPHCVVIIDGRNYVPVSTKITFNAHGATDDATATLTLSDNPDFTRALFRGNNSPGTLVAQKNGTLGIQLPTPSGGTTTTTATPTQIAAADAGGNNAPVFFAIWSGFRDNPAPTTDLTGLDQRFSGILDAYSMAPDSDEVTFTARSLAVPFIDQKITSAPMGMTSIDFVLAMANSQKLVANIALADGVKPITIQETLGREFISGSNFNTAVYNLHPWDLMLQTALFDDVDVWVDKDQLNYMAPSKVKRTTVSLKYGGDGKNPGIRNPIGTHSAQLNKNIRVEVRSYIRKTRQSTVKRVDTDPLGGIIVNGNSTTVSSSSPIFGTNQVVSNSISPTGVESTKVSSSNGGGFNGSTSTASESGKMIYKIYRPNLTPERCNQLATALWRQYSMHEYSLSFELPVTTALLKTFSITSLLRISGLPYDKFNSHTTNDQYYPRQIVESFDVTSGWVWAVQATNAILPSGAV